MDFADYQAIDAVNWSTLKHMGDSPLHYSYAYGHPRDDTTRLLLGRAVHTAVLEPDEFPLRYAVYEGGIRRGKEWDEFCAVNEGRDILKSDEYRLCLSVRDAVRGHAEAAALLTGESEVVKQWTDPATGIACKARLDHLNAHALVDLKTTGTTDAYQFEGTAARMDYHKQLAFYRRGVGDDRPVYIIAVEIDPPHDVCVFEYTEVALAIGDRKVSEYLHALHECRTAGLWPGRYSGIQELSLPAWMENEAAIGGGWDL